HQDVKRATGPDVGVTPGYGLDEDDRVGLAQVQLDSDGGQGAQDLVHDQFDRGRHAHLTGESLAKVIEQVKLFINVDDLARQVVDLARNLPGLRETRYRRLNDHPQRPTLGGRSGDFDNRD